MRHGLGGLSTILSGLTALTVAGVAHASMNVPPNATFAPTPESQTITFNVYLPIVNRAGLQALIADQQNPKSASYHNWLTPDQFQSKFGATPAAIASVSAAMQAQGFRIVSVQGQAVKVTGTVAHASQAFATRFDTVQTPDGREKIVATSAMTLPAALRAQGAVVPAFTGMARLHTHSRTRLTVPASRLGPAGGYFFDDLKQAYNYPSYQSLDGTGANVAVLISSDAYDFDINNIFNNAPFDENFTAITGKPAPTVTHEPVDQAATSVTDGLDEASLDVQQVLGGAPGAKVAIVDVPDLSDDSIIDGYAYIDFSTTSSGKARFQLVNSSFGGCELFYTAPYNGGVDETYLLDVEQALFEQGNSEGITFVASSGDSGGLGCPDVNYFNIPQTAPSRFLAGVEFPASSPNVTAVGGTNLVTTYNPTTLDSAYVSENAQGDPEVPYDPYGIGVNVYGGYWGAGGGISQVFTKPAYQALVTSGSSTYRTLPDIGMQVGGCPGISIYTFSCPPNRSYVVVSIAGGLYGLIGTSVASPEFVGALALDVQKTGGPLGNINPFLYAQGAAQTAGGPAVYHRAIPGFDGKYTGSTPSAGYTYLVGNGTPDVRALLGMSGLPAAGVPQTPANP